MKKFHLRRYCYLLLAALCCAATGCQPSSVSTTAADPRGAESAVAPELTLAEQIAAVERGETTRILVEREVLDNQALVECGKLASLTDLLLDNPESEYDEGGVAWLTELPNLQHVRIRGQGINSECLHELAKIKSLRIVNVPRGVFPDEGLEYLAALPNLESLRFGSPFVTDEGMKTIARWPAIRRLHLIDVPITDAGLAELAKIERLQSLYIDGGQITDAGWDALFRQRPKLHVHVNQQHLDRDPNKHPP